MTASFIGAFFTGYIRELFAIRFVGIQVALHLLILAPLSSRIRTIMASGSSSNLRLACHHDLWWYHADYDEVKHEVRYFACSELWIGLEVFMD